MAEVEGFLVIKRTLGVNTRLVSLEGAFVVPFGAKDTGGLKSNRARVSSYRDLLKRSLQYEL